MTDDRITVRDCRKFGYCLCGSKLFAKKHNLDWRRFVREGISVTELLATGDSMARRIIVKTFPDKIVE